MSLVDCKVELGLILAGGAGDLFILDSDTLGVLGTSELSGLSWSDVSDHTQNVQITRGRSRQGQYFEAGSASILFKNNDRLFDPLNESSIFYPAIEPRVPVRISSNGHWLFTGYVNDWDFEYDISKKDSATAYCFDAYGILSNQTLDTWIPSDQLSGLLLTLALERPEIAFRGARVISSGLSTLRSGTIAAGTNLLNYLRRIERSEMGALFIDASGAIVFRERAELPKNEYLTFADDGSGIEYQTLQNQYGDELIYNYVTANNGGTAQVKSDQNSILKFQTSSLNVLDLLNLSTTEVGSIANTLLNRFKRPKIRLTGFSVQLLGMSDANKDKVLTIELTDFCYLKKSFTEGSPSSFTQSSVITGIRHEIFPDSHKIMFTVENSADWTFLVLGEPVAGQLDSGQLIF